MYSAFVTCKTKYQGIRKQEKPGTARRAMNISGVSFCTLQYFVFQNQVIIRYRCEKRRSLKFTGSVGSGRENVKSSTIVAELIHRFSDWCFFLS